MSLLDIKAEVDKEFENKKQAKWAFCLISRYFTNSCIFEIAEVIGVKNRAVFYILINAENNSNKYFQKRYKKLVKKLHEMAILGE